MLAFGRPRAVLLAAGVLLVAAGTADDPSPTREHTATAVARTTTTFESSTDATVPRSSTTATTTTVMTVVGDGDDVTTTTEAGDASTTSTTRATTTTTRGEGATTSTTAAPTTTSTAPPPCPTGEVVWTAGFSATSEGDDRWSIETDGTLHNDTGAAVEITSVTTSIAVSDGTAAVRGRPEPRQLAPGGRGSFTGEATAHSSTEPAYRSTTITARWADESLRARCPEPR